MKKAFIYFQLYAKCIGLIFALTSVFIFILQFLPSYIGKGGAFAIFFIGGCFWGLDTLFSTCEDIKAINKEIKYHYK